MVLYFFYNESIYKEGVYMIIFRLVLVALLGFCCLICIGY